MKKLKQGFSSRMYLTLVALLIIVTLTGFVGKGKSVTIEYDGQSQDVYTHAVNAEALLREENIELGPYDEVELSTPQLMEGTTLVVRRAVPVRLMVKNNEKIVYTAKKTVQAVADACGYSEPNYRPYGQADARVEKGSLVKVAVLSRKEVTEDEVMPYPIETIPDDTLARGEEKVVQQGVDGRKTVKNNIIYADGKPAGKEFISATVISEVQPLIRHVGTQNTVDTYTDASGAAVDAGNTTSSRYKAIMRMTATAYLPTDGDGRGITKMGVMARYGIVAVDPHVIPLGTRVFIPGYGTALAADTGGDINGARIDLCMESYSACMSFGRRPVDVYILD